MNASLLSTLRRALLVLVFSVWAGDARAAELRVSTDFEGGSARVESIDQAARVIRVMPGGDPQRGWPCWWFFRLDGVEKDERVTIDLGGSDRPARNNGKDTGKPLDPRWAMPVRAMFSTDGETWRHTAPGRKQGKRIHYEVTGTGGPLWIAWGPPFTSREREKLIAEIEKAVPGAKAFELSKTREGRSVRGLRFTPAAAPERGVWVQARQHAWESGASWVAAGFAEWLASSDADARWLRENVEVVLVPIMDVDNVATGNGGKEAHPQDHNRDWSADPGHPEIRAAQVQLRAMADAGRLDLFLDLHNPGYSDLRPFFFMAVEELLEEVTRKKRVDFLGAVRGRMTSPLPVEETPRYTGSTYHPLWKQMSGIWITEHTKPQALALCLETPWNTPHSTQEGYRAVGRQLAQAVADYLKGNGGKAAQ